MSSGNVIHLMENLKIPKRVRLRCGEFVDCSSEIWSASDTAFSCKWKFNEITSEYFRITLKLYASYLLQVSSLRHADNSFRAVKYFLAEESITEPSEESLIKALKNKISRDRGGKQEYRLWYLKHWYNWCSGLSLSFFSDSFAESLSMISFSGNEKGQAVMSLDDNEGPLTEGELDLFINLLSRDHSEERLRSRTIAWLSLTLGCNPMNLCLLRWSDFTVHKNESDGHNVYLLNVPRIKKRLSGVRDDFKLRELDGRVGAILDRYRKSSCSDLYLFSTKDGKQYESRKVAKELIEYATWLFCSHSDDGIQIKITPRRLRYTFATRLVMAGVSKEKLADLLDHSDLQHVQIYYDLRHKIKSFLSEAESKKLGEVFRRFEGNIIGKEKEAKFVGDIKYNNPKSPDLSIVGNCSSSSLCDLDPPYSCFLCPKFNAFEESLNIYRKILNHLVEWSNSRREEYGENDRIATVRNDVMIALGDLISRIEKKDVAS